jgi:hypothetical protein
MRQIGSLLLARLALLGKTKTAKLASKVWRGYQTAIKACMVGDLLRLPEKKCCLEIQ